MASIIIPAHNEEKNIANVLKKIPKGHDIVVVDDGSTDRTFQVAKKFCRNVVRLETNMGKTYACLEGAKRSRSEFCIFLDGDGQHDAAEIPKFLDALGKYDIVVGQRDTKNIPFPERLSNIYARRIVNSITGARYHDVLCGFRAARKKALENMRFRKRGYFFEPEMLLNANGATIGHVPVSVKYNGKSRIPLIKSLHIGAWLFGRYVRNKMIP